MATNLMGTRPSAANIVSGAGVLYGLLASHGEASVQTVTFYDNTEATVQAWVWEAVQDYSVYFSRTSETTIACADGEHSHDLPNDFQDMVLVEYPDGEDPPEYLVRMSRKRSAFWEREDCYDVEPSDQTNDVDAVLWISAEAETGETIRITYRRHYYDLTGVDDPETLIYVPEPHHPILVQYVVWRAQLERYNWEIKSPDPTNVILAQLSDAARRTRATYEGMIDRAQAQGSRSLISEPWRSDVYDPIY